MRGQNFKLGLFVVSAVGLLVAVLLALGSLDRFRPSTRVETYFIESIEGLQVGAPVKYRGVQVGRVGQIAFAASKYTDEQVGPSSGAVMANLVLDSERLVTFGVDEENVEARLSVAVEAGLRARLASSGLGGPAFVELQFLDTELFPAPSVSWVPENPVIPSASSTITGIVGSLETILTRLDEGEFATKLMTALGTAEKLSDTLSKLQESEMLQEIGSSFEALADASRAVSELARGERLENLLDQTSSTLADARELLASEDPDGLRTTLAELRSTANALEKASIAVDTLVAQVDRSGLVDELGILASSAGPAVDETEELMSRLNALIGDNAPEIADTIHSLRDAALRLEALIEEAESNPSRMILGDPPPRRNDGASP